MRVLLYAEDIARETVSRLRSRLHSRSLPPLSGKDTQYSAQRRGCPIASQQQRYTPIEECIDTPARHIRILPRSIEYILLQSARRYTCTER